MKRYTAPGKSTKLSTQSPFQLLPTKPHSFRKAHFPTPHPPVGIQAWEDTAWGCFWQDVFRRELLHRAENTESRPSSLRMLWEVRVELPTQDCLVWKINVTGTAFGPFCLPCGLLPNYFIWRLELHLHLSKCENGPKCEVWALKVFPGPLRVLWLFPPCYSNIRLLVLE